MPTPKDYIDGDMIAAVAAIMTPMTVLIFIAFLSQRKKPGLRIPATICLLSSILGTSLGWVGLVGMCEFQDNLALLRWSMKLVLLGGALVMYPILVCPRWLAYWVASILKRQPPEPRALFRISGFPITLWLLFDTLRWALIIISLFGLVDLWRLASI
jgi:hypothetical protein